MFAVLDACACPSAVPIISDCNAELVFPPLSHDCLEGQTFHQSSFIEPMHGRKERAKMWDQGTEAKGKRNREGREVRRGTSATPPPHKCNRIGLIITRDPLRFLFRAGRLLNISRKLGFLAPDSWEDFKAAAPDLSNPQPDETKRAEQGHHWNHTPESKLGLPCQPLPGTLPED